MLHKVEYGSTVISYYVSYADRKTLAIEVHPDLSVKIVAPTGTSEDVVKVRIVKRGKWIKRNQRYFEEFLPRTPRREYVSGESHNYLGRRYKLRIRRATKDAVRIAGSELIVHTVDDHVQHVKRLLGGWYYQRAHKRFNYYLRLNSPRFKRFGIGEPELTLRRMLKRWGSCTAGGKIILNPELVKAPPRCIEYVVIHELCHLVYPNHGKAFQQLLRRMLPDWERWKGRLERISS